MPPSAHAVLAFGGDPARLHSLPGGRGHSWAAGEIVLKPLDLSLEELRWQWRLLPELHPQDVRLAPPRRTATGDLVVEGWTAWERLAGRHQPGRWEDIIAAGDRFHRALAGVPRPAFFNTRTSPWAIADRIAWGDQSPERFTDMVGTDRLLALRAPVVGAPQCVHGDLTGNVIFSPGLAPGVIDFSPYWRPPVFATAVVVGDALLFEGATPALAEAHRMEPGFAQALVRALLFRLISNAIIHSYPTGPPVWLAHTVAIEVAERLVRGV